MTSLQLPSTYLPTPRVQKSGDVYKSSHCKNVIFYNVQKLSEIPLKAFRMFSTSITVCKNHTNFLPSIVQFDWLISNQLLYSLNIYQIDSSALRFPFEFSSNKSTKSTSCFIFLFDLSKIMKLMKKLWKRSWKAFPGRFGVLTGRPGDLMKNLETPGKTGRVGRYVSKADSCFCLAMRYRHINFPTDTKVNNIINSLHEEFIKIWNRVLAYFSYLFLLFINRAMTCTCDLWPVTCILYLPNFMFHLNLYQISWIYLMI